MTGIRYSFTFGTRSSRSSGPRKNHPRHTTSGFHEVRVSISERTSQAEHIVHCCCPSLRINDAQLCTKTVIPFRLENGRENGGKNSLVLFRSHTTLLLIFFFTPLIMDGDVDCHSIQCELSKESTRKLTADVIFFSRSTTDERTWIKILRETS